MKKIIILSLLSGLFLVGCGSNSDKKETSTSKVDQLESRVKELENSSSSEVKESKQQKTPVTSKLSSDINKKIAEAFLENDLKMYNAQADGPAEMQPVPEDNPTNRPIYKSGMSFYVENAEDSFIIYIENYASSEELSTAKNFLIENAVDQPLVSENNSIFSIMYAYPRIASKSNKENDEKDFTKYKEVFESIK